MCINMRWVRNPYTHRSIFVSCGHCPACQQEKANKRTARIKNNSRKGYINLFVTLTYKNDYVPFILRSDLADNKSVIPVYRASTIRKVRKSASYRIGNRQDLCPVVLDEVNVESRYYDDFDINVFHDCAKTKGRIGVIYYKDIQNFYKRLRINLNRHYNYVKPFSFFTCSELGSSSGRPHFHSVVSIPFEDIEIFKRAIFESWPFDSENRRLCGIEVAKNVASYVSSYVNKSASFPHFFTQNSFKPKHSYSQGYGLGNVDFSLPQIQEKVRRRDLSYYVRVIRDGIPENVSLPVPEYVINRYFPKFKGYSRITRNQIYKLLSNPLQRNGIFYELGCNDDDAYKITTSLANSFLRYKSLTSYDINEKEYIHRYAMDFINTWIVYDMNKLRRFYENRDGLSYPDMYDNFSFVASGRIKSPTLIPFVDVDGYLKNMDLYDPNKIPARVEKTISLTDLYNKKEKSRHVTNAVLSKISDSF